MNADKVFEFNNGTITHSGTFEELCKNSGSFQDLNVLEKKILEFEILFIYQNIYQINSLKYQH